MGSAASSPNRNGSDDPWWPLENQNLSLNDVQPLPTMDEENNLSSDSVRGGTELNSSELLQNRNDIVAVVDSNEEENSYDDEQLIYKSDENKNTQMSDSASEIVDGASIHAHCSNAALIHSNALEKDSLEQFEARRAQLQPSQSLDEFKEELRIKREMRKTVINELHNEIKHLRKQLADEKALNKKLSDEKYTDGGDGANILENIAAAIADSDDDDDNKPSSKTILLRAELANVQLALQDANSEILSLTSELNGTRKQVDSLKEVVSVSKQMVEIRETQLTQLKAKLTEIESSLAERELHLMSENLRQEYDRQLANIRNLRALYDERARVNAAERENLNRQLETSRAELASEIEKNKNLEEHLASLDNDLKNTTADLYGTREQLAYYKAENKGLHDEMAVINQLFSQLLVGFNGRNDINIDKLTNMLEENRDLLNDMTSRESCKEGAAQLPKLLFDLVSQAADGNADSGNESAITSDEQSDNSSNEEDEKQPKLTSAQEIMRNLPKVWRVLIELLNHQKMDPVKFTENDQGEDCYKSVQTPTGPQMVLSVSKTYIKLKDLILEKKFLQKETNKLKNLNSHLDYRLEQQEKRLGTVTIELNKTWNLVGRMQRQHRQLHTHEQVLRYQLQQKRRLMNELKEELEYCRRKWNLAKEKNKESQSQWDSLRLEFRRRKEQDASTSVESGYSDGPVSEEEDDEESEPTPAVSKYETKRKPNKEKFLLKIDSAGKKALRIHSVSPIRCAKTINVLRRNSESQITQFATETIEAATATVQPVEQYTIEKIEHVPFSIEDMVRAGAPAQKLVRANDELKILEPRLVRPNPTPGPSNVAKLVESKISCGSRPKMSFELRKKNTAKPDASKAEESLEEMFFRLSGQSQPESSTSSSTNDPIQEVLATTSQQDRIMSIEERRAKRAARIQKLEEQCKSLISQITRTTNKNVVLNQQLDNFKHRCTSLNETPPLNKMENENPITDAENSIPQNNSNIAQSLSGPLAGPSSAPTKQKTDEECLSAREVEYTSKRAERLKRLEEGYKAFLKRVQITNDKANNVTKQLDNLHERYKNKSNEPNVDAGASKDEPTTETDSKDMENCDVDDKLVNSNAEEENSNLKLTPKDTDAAANVPAQSLASSSLPIDAERDISLLTTRELEYVSKRNERLKRLEEESKAFLLSLQKRNQKKASFINQLDELTTGSEAPTTEAQASGSSTSETKACPAENAEAIANDPSDHIVPDPHENSTNPSNANQNNDTNEPME